MMRPMNNIVKQHKVYHTKSSFSIWLHFYYAMPTKLKTTCFPPLYHPYLQTYSFYPWNWLIPSDFLWSPQNFYDKIGSCIRLCFRKNPFGFHLNTVVVNDSAIRSLKNTHQQCIFHINNQHYRRWFSMIKILFICHGNICRSPIVPAAQGFWNWKSVLTPFWHILLVDNSRIHGTKMIRPVAPGAFLFTGFIDRKKHTKSWIGHRKS